MHTKINILLGLSNTQWQALLCFITARLWKHRWRVLAGSGEHILDNQPGELQAAGHLRGLVWTQDICRVRKFPS